MKTTEWWPVVNEVTPADIQKTYKMSNWTTEWNVIIYLLLFLTKKNF